ncbi:MAG: NADP-dependent oxidoreductase [Gemmatimonadota bacterium]
MIRGREVRLRRRPVGMPVPEDFSIVEAEIGDPGPGEVVVQNLFLSVDPYMRGRMSDQKSYAPPYEVGKVMTGGAVGRVVASRDDQFAEGDLVVSAFGWREAFCAPGDRLRAIGEMVASPSAYLGVLGMPGMTAYVGLFEIAELKDGETVLVSGAAGAVGSVAGQIARLKGCRVLGSAGGPDKVRHLTDELGFDFAFDYREGKLSDHLREGAPDGLDVYFDNVGGKLLEAAIGQMRVFGRIALCGSISRYNDTELTPGPANLSRAVGWCLTLRGFLVSRYEHVRERFLADMSEWLRTGRIAVRETIVEGIEAAPEAFIGLFTGANLGKMVVKVDDAE